MTLDKTRADELDLHQLLTGIDLGQIVLPDFQRDFDWVDSDVRSLLATVLSGWPIGSLLLMEGPPTFFDIRAIESAPAPQPPIRYVVLDGQQRLTALYQSLYGQGDLVYALKLENLGDHPEIDSLDEAIVTFKRDFWVRHHSSPAEQLSNGLLPISALRSAADFFEWRDAAVSQPSPTTDLLTSLYRSFLGGLHDYDVPAVIVARDVEPAAIARIFERVNRTGMSLSTFDLMVARSYAPNFNLRQAWEQSRVEHPHLQAFFGKDGLPVLTLIALRVSGDLRQQAVLNLTGSSVRDMWASAASHMVDAIRFAAEYLGIWQPDWLPYKNILTILAALSYDFDLVDRRHELQRWYWKTVFGGRYDAASNTRAVNDYRLLLKSDTPTPKPLALERGTYIEATKRQQGALHRAFLTALASNEPRDLLSGVTLSASGIENGRLPDAVSTSVFLHGNTQEAEPAAHLLSLGMVLAEPSSARHITLARLREADGSLLNSQLIGDVAPLESSGSLIASRLERLRRYLSELTGDDVRLISEAEGDAI